MSMHVEDIDDKGTSPQKNNELSQTQDSRFHKTEHSAVSNKSVAVSLKESRVTYKFQQPDLGGSNH